LIVNQTLTALPFRKDQRYFDNPELAEFSAARALVAPAIER
jgi:hypothetical protein